MKPVNSLSQDSQNPKKPLNQLRIMIITIIFFAYLIQDIFTRKFLIAFSNELAVKMQQKIQKNDFQRIFLILISDFTYFIITLYFFVGFIFTSQKLNSIIFLFYGLFVLYINNLMKLIYADPRPFMICNEVRAIQCETDLGNPSGHCNGILFFLFAFPYSLNKKFYQTSAWRQNNSILVYLILSTIITFFVGVSRFSLGVHSLNQILLGFICAIYQCYLYIEIVHDAAAFHLDRLIKQIFLKNQQKNEELFNLERIQSKNNIDTSNLSNSSSSQDSVVMVGKKYRLEQNIVQIEVILFIFLSLIPLMCILYQREANTDKLEYYLDQLKIKCHQYDQMTLYSPDFLVNQSFLATSIVTLSFGILTGIVYLSRKKIFRENDYFFNYLKAMALSSNFWKFILRLIIYSLCLITPIMLFYLLFMNIPKNQEYSVYVFNYLYFCPSYIISGILLIQFPPYIFEQLRLSLQGDFLNFDFNQDSELKNSPSQAYGVEDASRIRESLSTSLKKNKISN